jgi:hypothetical protein
VIALLGDRARRQPTGYATDALWPEIHYMPEDMEVLVDKLTRLTGRMPARRAVRIRYRGPA